MHSNKLKYFKYVACTLLLACLTLLKVNDAHAETIYLENGELLKGQIVSIDSEEVVVESDLGYGRIKIPREQVINIRFPNYTKVDLNRRFAIGINFTGNLFASRVYQVRQLGAQIDTILFRTYIARDWFLDFSFGYTGFAYFDDTLQNRGNFFVLNGNAQVNYAVFRYNNAVINLGGLFGTSFVDNRIAKASELIFSFGASIGFEVFFESLPRLSVGAEIEALMGFAVGFKRRAAASFLFSAKPSLGLYYYF